MILPSKATLRLISRSSSIPCVSLLKAKPGRGGHEAKATGHTKTAKGLYLREPKPARSDRADMTQSFLIAVLAV